MREDEDKQRERSSDRPKSSEGKAMQKNQQQKILFDLDNGLVINL